MLGAFCPNQISLDLDLTEVKAKSAASDRF